MNVTIQCEYCGKDVEVRKAEVNRGHGRYCGRSCAATHRNRKRPKKGKTKLSYSDQKILYGDKFMFSQLVSRVRERARKSGLECDLDSSMFMEMWKEHGGKCHYTNRVMTVGNGTRKKIDLDQVSVDRVDSSGGYIRGNMVLCCRWINSGKLQGSIEDIVIRAKELICHYDDP